MAKIKLHNILQVSDQALFSIHMDSRRAEFLPSILFALSQEEMPITFVVQSIGRDGTSALSLTTAQQNLDWVRAAFQEGLDLQGPTFLNIRQDVVLITIYGPHLGEIPGVASRIFAALVDEGVEVLAHSSSINSSLIVIPQNSLAKAQRALDRICEIPSK